METRAELYRMICGCKQKINFQKQLIEELKEHLDKAEKHLRLMGIHPSAKVYADCCEQNHENECRIRSYQDEIRRLKCLLASKQQADQKEKTYDGKKIRNARKRTRRDGVRGSK